MAEDNFYLSADDAAELDFRRDQQLKQRQNPSRATRREPDWIQSDVFVALPPCGKCIPKRQGDKPGMEVCCIMRLHFREPANSDIVIAPRMVIPDDNLSQVREPVYNIWDHDICYVKDGYIRIQRNREGVWLADPVDFGTSSGTTTTQGPFPTNPGLVNSPCVGVCEWEPDGAKEDWVLVSETCQPNTTTTTTTTTTSTSSTTSTSGDSTSSTTTTTTDCLCPVLEDTSTTTTSSTTSTTAGCECVKPSYCPDPTLDCQVVITSCAKGAHVNTPDCSSATTTSPDCSNNVTCGAGCWWFSVPGTSTVIPLTIDCESPCGCEIPQGGDECKELFTPCVYFPPTPEPQVCEGDCAWVCVPQATSSSGTSTSLDTSAPGQWALYDSRCSGNVPCGCVPVTGPCTLCERTTGPCGSNMPFPPPDPCGPTTSSTTSTTSCDNGYCLHQYLSSIPAWVIVEDKCTPACPCTNTNPGGVGVDCETRKIPCPQTTSSTTTTTLENCPPIGFCSCQFSCSGGVWVLFDSSCGDCEGDGWGCPPPPAGSCFPDGGCIESSCVQTSTTTSSTTTTTCDNTATGCCLYDDTSSFQHCGNMTQCACQADPGPGGAGPGVWSAGQVCDSETMGGSCVASTTTTTETSSTTSTTQACGEPSAGNAMYQWQSGEWVLVGTNGCEFPPGPPAGGGSEGQCVQTACA